MKRILTCIFSMGCLMLVWQACSSDSLRDADVASVPIRFGTVTICQDGLTRTAVMGADEHNTGLPMGSDIDVFVYNSSGNPVPSDDEENNDPAVTLPLVYVTTEEPNPDIAQSALNLKNAKLASPKYPSGNDAYIFAVWPSMATTKEADDDLYTFTVSNQQNIPENVTASDLLATDKIIQPQSGGKAIDLAMTHCMAKVLVKFNPTGSLTAANMPSTFTILGVKNSVTIKPRTAATSNGRAAITTNDGTTDILGSTDEALLIPPQRIDAGSTFLRFDITGKSADHFADITDVTFKLTNPITFEANSVYEITVNVNVNYITISTTITPWNTEDMTFDKYIL